MNLRRCASILLVCLCFPAQAGRVAPHGIITPKKGPYAGQRIPYGDNSTVYTRIAEYTIPEIEAFLQGKKKPPPGWELKGFLEGKSNKMIALDFGGQLTKEGYDQYEHLVRDCLENGEVDVKNKHCTHRASRPIGYNSETYKPTNLYSVTLILNYWLVEAETHAD